MTSASRCRNERWRTENATGAALGDDFLVNTSTEGFQDTPDIARAADGSFVVVWQDAEQDAIVARRYDGIGAPRLRGRRELPVAPRDHRCGRRYLRRRVAERLRVPERKRHHRPALRGRHGRVHVDAAPRLPRADGAERRLPLPRRGGRRARHARLAMAERRGDGSRRLRRSAHEHRLRALRV
jgi:hypothetical protein